MGGRSSSRHHGTGQLDRAWNDILRHRRLSAPYQAAQSCGHPSGTVLGGLALNESLKFVFDRPRPDIVPQSVRVFTTSFPSGHAALSSVAYLTIAALLAPTTPSYSIRLYVMAVAVLVTIAVGISRVYLGLHYPTDVLAGWCIGSAWALMCWVAANQLQLGDHGWPKP